TELDGETDAGIAEDFKGMDTRGAGIGLDRLQKQVGRTEIQQAGADAARLRTGYFARGIDLKEHLELSGRLDLGMCRAARHDRERRQRDDETQHRHSPHLVRIFGPSPRPSFHPEKPGSRRGIRWTCGMVPERAESRQTRCIRGPGSPGEPDLRGTRGRLPRVARVDRCRPGKSRKTQSVAGCTKRPRTSMSMERG